MFQVFIVVMITDFCNGKFYITQKQKMCTKSQFIMSYNIIINQEILYSTFFKIKEYEIILKYIFIIITV